MPRSIHLRCAEGSYPCDKISGSLLCGYDFGTQEITHFKTSASLYPGEEIVTIKAKGLGEFTLPLDTKLVTTISGDTIYTEFLESGDVIWGLDSADRLKSFQIQNLTTGSDYICVVESVRPYLLQVGKKSLFCCSG